MSRLRRPIFVDLALVLAMALLAVVGYRYSPLLLPKADLNASPDPNCDLNRSACSASLPGLGQVELSLGPRPVPVVKPLQVVARLQGFAARQVDIDFAGVTMNMGYNRQTLQAAGGDTFQGEATIPVCVTGRMAWVATLLIETDRQRISIPFHFEAPLS